MKICVIGSGISGLTCVSLLKNTNDVTLIEKQNQITFSQGHITLPCGVNIDIPLRISETAYYSNYYKFINKLDVAMKQVPIAMTVDINKQIHVIELRTILNTFKYIKAYIRVRIFVLLRCSVTK